MKPVVLKQQSDASQHPIPQSSPPAPARKRPSYFQMQDYPHQTLCQQLSYMLIRPPRFLYNPDILKPNKRNSKRFQLQNIDIGPFELSFYKQKNMRYVVLYLHGNGSSRFQGCLFLHSLPDEVGLACFDFNGCGNREEEKYITLGQNECKDVDVAARHLKNQGYIVVGWGRSMGGVSLLKSNQLDIMVTDSAYSDLSDVCKQSSTKFVPKACCCLVHLLFPCVFACLSCKVQSLSGLQLNKMDITKRVKQISQGNHNKQICFIHGEEDSLVHKQHAQRLYEAFQGPKMLIYFEGTHNSSRPDEVINKCFGFIQEALKGQRTCSSKSGRLAGNYKLEKMVQLEQIDRNHTYKDKQCSPTTVKVSKSSEQGERDITNAHLNSQYSNSPRIKNPKLRTQFRQDQNYCEAGNKIQLILRGKTQESNKMSTYKSVASLQGVQATTTNENSRVNIDKKQEEIIRKVFKQN